MTPHPVWLITGSNSGFGGHIAQAALDRGDTVVATARRPETLDALLASAPDHVLVHALDVTRQGDSTAAVAAAIERFGRIDILVNNAGYGTVGAVEEIDIADLRAVMDTMFFGAVELTQAVLPHMRAQGSGAIVQISSMGGQWTAPGFGAYCAAKFALEGLSESLAAEVGAMGIDVMIVEPGAFRTEFGGTRMHRSREIPPTPRPSGRRAPASTQWTAPSQAIHAKRPKRSSAHSQRSTRRSTWHSERTRSR